MSFRTIDQILTDLQEAIEAQFPTARFRTGGVTTTLTEAIGLALADLYLKVEEAIQNFYIETAEGEYLDKKGEDYGLVRKPGVKASGTARFSRLVAAVNDIPIVAGSTFATPPDSFGNRLEFQTTIEGTLLTGETFVDISSQAAAEGINYNINSGEVLEITSQLDAIDSVTNTTTFSGGKDIETDDEFRQRIKLYIQTLSKGTKAALRSAALNVPGVKFVNVVESGTNDGIVTVYIDDGSGQASSELIAQVVEAIDLVRAAGIIVNTYAVSLVEIDLIMVIVLQSGYTFAAVESSIKTVVREYIDSLTVGESVIYSKVYGNIILVDGVADLTSLTLNTGTANITINEDEVAKTGTITIT
jgi:uncharacterized phage protein gp47/JayE